MTRPTNWPELLAAFVRARSVVPFKWGANDCVSMAADWVELVGGPTIERDWRDASSAAHAIRERGGLRLAVSAVLGEGRDWKMTQRGDVVLLMIDGRETLGVCVGTLALVPTVEGARLHPIGDALCSWEV